MQFQILFLLILCLCKSNASILVNVARREWGDKEYALPSQRRERLAHPFPRINASVPRCDISCTTAARDGGVARRSQQRGQGIPVGSNRLAVQHKRFAMGSAAMSVDRECAMIEVCGRIPHHKPYH